MQNILDNKRNGFTLVELVVVAGIFALITSLFLARTGQFGEQVLLENLSYDIALSVRQAQVFGLSVRGTEEGLFTGGYGIYFSADTPDSYLFFADVNTNDMYDEGEELEILNISRGNTISDIRGMQAIGGEGRPLDYASVVYKRPEPEAHLDASDGGTYTAIVIVIQTPGGAEKSITVAASGQIAVE